jgi:hypothetical protein
MAETENPFGGAPFGGGPFGPKPAVGTTNFAQAVTANVSASASLTLDVGKIVLAGVDVATVFGAKSITFAVTAAVDAAASIVKAVTIAVVAALFDAAASVVKAVDKPLTAALASVQGEQGVKNVAFALTAQVTAAVSAILATLFIVSRNILMDPINCVLAGHQRIFDRLREYDIRPRNLRRNTVGKTAGTRRLGGDKPSFRVRTDKKGYD